MIEHDAFDDQHDASSSTAPTQPADITAPIDLAEQTAGNEIDDDTIPGDGRIHHHDGPAAGALQVTDADGTRLDVGEPTLSSSGGDLDSVVRYSEHGAELFTDNNGDGTVDQIVRVGLDGGVTAWNLDDDGSWQLTVSGRFDADGGLDLRPHGSDESGPVATTSAGPTIPEATGDAAGPNITVPGADGTGFTGPATYDADGDGVPDTVVVHSDDGSLTTASDLDGDGVADQLVVLAADGTVTVSSADGAGGWAVIATGVQNPDGTISVDEADGAASGSADPSAEPAEPTAEPTPEPPADQSAEPTAEPTAEPAAGRSAEPTAEQSAEPTDEPVGTETGGDVPEGHLAVSDGDGFSDAGVPQYDLNGDGVPETAVQIRDGVLYQYSDTDGDGRADQLLRVNVDDRSAEILVDGEAGWQVAVTGTIDADGDFVAANSEAGVGGRDEPEQATGAAQGQDVPVTHSASAPAITVTMPDGQPLALHAPDQDIDGDGVAESVAVRTGDGHLLIVSDADADGVAEQVIDVDSDTGLVRWLAIADDGSWSVAQHGHLSESGELVVDGDGEGTTEELQGAAVTVSVDGRTFPAGPASIDSDGDGIADTVVVPGIGGSIQHYQDADGDGIADRAWTVNADGTVGTVYAIDDSGNWMPLDEAPAAGAGSPLPRESPAGQAEAERESPKGWFE